MDTTPVQNASVKYTLPDEFKFYKLMLENMTDKKYEIFKSKSKYCNVDFMILDKYFLKKRFMSNTEDDLFNQQHLELSDKI